MNTLKNNKGFGSTLGLMFITIFSAILIAASFIQFTIDTRSDVRIFCYNDLYDVQKILVDHEERLMALNPLAQALRLRLTYLYIQLAAAIASENIPLALQTAQWIEQTKQQQRALKFQQQSLISFGQSYARIRLTRSYRELIAKIQQRSEAWSEILQIQNGIWLNTFLPAMAVSPDNPTDIAPVYRFNPGFENQQKITAFWLFSFFAKPSFQTLIETEKNWRLQCSSEPRRADPRPLVKADRL